MPMLKINLPNWFRGWEVGLISLVATVWIVGTVIEPNFFTNSNFSTTFASSIGIALMVIPMAWLIISGEIDLSVASIYGLSASVLGRSLEAGNPFWLSMILALVVAGLAGLINGFLVVNFHLPSLVVTVGTLALYRGIAFILLEYRAYSDFPTAFTNFAQNTFGNSPIPQTGAIFFALALVAGLLLQSGGIGRKVYAIGSNLTVSNFSAIRVRRIKRGMFVFSGLVSGIAGILYAGYTSSARANNGTGLELSIIAIVLIGGISMYGGKGRFVGVLLSLILVTSLTSWMNLKYISSSIQYTVIGMLMIGAVVVPAISEKISNFRAVQSERQNVVQS